MMKLSVSVWLPRRVAVALAVGWLVLLAYELARLV